MARPTKNGDDKRALTIRVRVTLAEKEAIWEASKAAGMTPSDFMRNKAISVQPLRRLPPPEREALLKLQAELGKIGSNVNQIARALNRRQDTYDLIGVTAESITHAMNGVDSLTEYLLKVWEHGH